MSKFVMLVNGAVVAIFDSQQDKSTCPGFLEVADDDPRYLAFIQPNVGSVIAGTRYDFETAGITINGQPIDTGRDSQALITGAALSALMDPAYVCNWKTSTGAVSLNAEQLKVIATAVRAHVQACFDREIALLAAVAAGTYTEAMLAEGWPT